MRGRTVFLESLVAHGVEFVFGNPGTTESPLLDSIGDHPPLRYVTHLHEGVAIGAASYYARASGRTAVANLHVAPGLGNGIGMIYNALKANAPLVVTAGQQDSRMLRREPLLAHDLAAMAAPVTRWSTQVRSADEMDEVMRRAFKVAADPPGGPVFVALPIDVMEQETANAALAPAALHRIGEPDPRAIDAIVALLARSGAPAIVVGDEVARLGACAELVAFAEALGAPVWFEATRGHASFPGSHPQARTTLPFDAAGIRGALGDADLVLLIGGAFFEDVWFTPGAPFPAGARVVQIEASARALAHNFPVDCGVVAGPGATLRALRARVDAEFPADWRAAAAARRAALAAKKASEADAYRARLDKAWAREPISMPRAMAELARATPADATIVEESITASVDFAAAFPVDDPGRLLGARGGGIGQGLAGAIGAAFARPGRPVLCVSGDGSAMYSIQALWTAARYRLPIVFAILANREYRVLKHNLDAYRQRFDAASARPYPEMDLVDPALGFVEMAAGMGVAGTRVTGADDLAQALRAAFAAGEPRLVEIAIEGKRGR